MRRPFPTKVPKPSMVAALVTEGTYEFHQADLHESAKYCPRTHNISKFPLQGSQQQPRPECPSHSCFPGFFFFFTNETLTSPKRLLLLRLLWLLTEDSAYVGKDLQSDREGHFH